MRRILPIASVLGLLLFSAVSAAKYKVKDIIVKPAAEYPAHQAFQNIVIGVQPCLTEAQILEVFDTKKLYERRIMPVIVVVENNNNFAIRLRGENVLLVGQDGENVPSLSLNEVLLRISLKRPLSSYSTREDILLAQSVKTDVRMDFERKLLGEKLIAPYDSDYGIVFFDMPEDAPATRIFFPEILNLRDEERLMFFEFPLMPLVE